MTLRSKLGMALIGVMVLSATAASAEPKGGHGGGGGEGMRPGAGRPAPQHAEPHPGPSGYQRVSPPAGWNTRPTTVNRSAYGHNFQAARSYTIGAYRRPAGWVSHRWGQGQFLPRAYWTSQYLLADYWLFSLEVPPVGYEWVRDDDDAILVNIGTGQILQVEYGVFS